MSTQITISSDAYLYCNGNYFTVTTANWTATDSITNANYNIFSYGSQIYYMSTNVTASASSKVLAGSLVNVNLKLTMKSTASAETSTKTFSTQI